MNGQSAVSAIGVVLLAVTAASLPAAAQSTLNIRVNDARTGSPVAGAIVTAGSAREMAVLSGVDGVARITVRGPRTDRGSAASESVTIERLGYRVAQLSVAPRDRMVTVKLQRVAWDELIHSRQTMPGCSVAFSDGEALWQQIRTDLRGGQLGRSGRVASAHVSRRWQVMNANQRADSARIEVRDTPLLPATPAPESLFAHGFVTKTPYSREFLAPNDLFFLDDAFTENYCISAGLGGGTGENSVLSVRFTPKVKRPDRFDIGGAFQVDTVHARLEMLEYDYLDLPDVSIERPRGAVVYSRLRDGSVFVTRWSQGVPMPTLNGYGNPGDPRMDSVRRVFIRATVLWIGNTVDSVTWADGVTYRADSVMRARLAPGSSTSSGAPRRFEIDTNPAHPLWGMIRQRAHFHPEVPYFQFDGVRVAALPSGRSVETGYGGAFGLDQLPANDTAIVMYHRGALPKLMRFAGPAGRIEATLESVTASQPPFVQSESSLDGVSRIAGAIGDTTLRPLDGAVVRLMGTNRSARTDEQGRFSLEARPGTYLMVVEHPEHARQIVGVTVRANRSAAVSLWMIPQVQAGEVVSDLALAEFAQRIEQNARARRLIARDEFGAVGTTLLTVNSVMRVARAGAGPCLVQVEGGEAATMPAEWLRPIDVELLEFEPATAKSATCGATLIRAWLRR